MSGDAALVTAEQFTEERRRTLKAFFSGNYSFCLTRDWLQQEFSKTLRLMSLLSPTGSLELPGLIGSKKADWSGQTAKKKKIKRKEKKTQK